MPLPARYLHSKCCRARAYAVAVRHRELRSYHQNSRIQTATPADFLRATAISEISLGQARAHWADDSTAAVFWGTGPSFVALRSAGFYG